MFVFSSGLDYFLNLFGKNVDTIEVLEEFEPDSKIDTKYDVRDIVKYRICD